MRVFIDNNLPPRLARAIHCLVQPEGHQVVHLRDRFAGDTSDVSWISTLGQEGDWTVITGDHDIVRRQAEKIVWRQNRLVAFLLSSGWSSFNPIEQAWRLIKTWPNLIAKASGARPGTVFEVTPSSGGKIRSL